MKRINNIYLLPVLVGSIIVSLMSFWIYYEMQIFETRINRVIKQEGDITVRAIKGIVQSQMIGGRIPKGRLEFIFSNIVDGTILKYICVENNDRTIYKSRSFGLSVPKVIKDNSIYSNIYYLSKSVEFKNPPPPFPPGRRPGPFPFNRKFGKLTSDGLSAFIHEQKHLKDHPEDYFNFNNRKQTIVVGLDIAILQKQMLAERNKTIIFFITFCIGVIILIIVWIYIIKNSRLKIKYAQIKAKNERLEELSLAASGLAHEIKNPLGIIRGLSQKMTETADLKSVAYIAEKVMDEADIVNERLLDFMNYAKDKQPSLIDINLKNYFAEVVDMISYELEDKKMTINMNIENINILADCEFLDKIVINILINSINACKEGSVIEIESLRENSDNMIALRISDNGPGIKSELLSEIFKPYISGSAKGHGIGLAIVKKLVDKMHWEICIDSELNKGIVNTISNIRIQNK